MPGSLAVLIVAGLIGLAENADRRVPYWVLAIHGGSGTIDRDAPEAVQEEYRAALAAALRAGSDVLAAGGTAIDACERVVCVLEDDPHFNAGVGAAFTENGMHELDASIMDGATMRCGAVAAVQTVRHPISLARAVMERTPHVLLMGSGAEAFADTTTLERVPNSFFSTERRRKMLEEVLQERRAKESVPTAAPGPPAKGTVGCVARDMAGNLAAATSTGGLTGKRHGRVGDSPIIGAGCFANATAAVSCTGTGEEFIRHGVARMVAVRMELLGERVAVAARYLIATTLRPDDGGLIAIDVEGDVAMPYSSQGMYRGKASGWKDQVRTLEVGVFEECVGIKTAAAPRDGGPGVQWRTGLNGTLLCIGGGLDEKNEPVLRRLGELATAAAKKRGAPPRLLIATTASGDEDGECLNIVSGIEHFCPELTIERIGRGTPRDEAVRLIDNADGMFFTGGDQKRITALYRPDGIDTPEATAMRRLLARGGVIAGTSAGDAMMGETMFRTGRSAEALGVDPTRGEAVPGGTMLLRGEGVTVEVAAPSHPAVPAPDDDPDVAKPALGPQLAPGMAFQPWVLTDSHFTERHRVGRLIAALEQSGTRLGIGISENACVEFNLGWGTASVVGDAPALLLDAGALMRNGLRRSGVRALMMRAGGGVRFVDWAATKPDWLPPHREWPRISIDATAPGAKAAELEAAVYSTARANPGSVARLELDGWFIEAWADAKNSRGDLCLSVGGTGMFDDPR